MDDTGGGFDFGVPEWTEKAEKRGNDPLGMQNTSVAIYQSLMPGISNVTLRVRYYGFYVWLADEYARKNGSTNIEEWCIFLRRAEALYALTAASNEESPGIAGTDWAKKTLDDNRRATIKFRSSTDRTGAPQYLKQKFGAFGAAYGSQLIEMGLLKINTEIHDIPTPTEKRGNKLRDAFSEAISSVRDDFIQAVNEGSVRRNDLVRFGVMLPQALSEDGDERDIYEQLIFAELPDAEKRDIDRSTSCKLALMVFAEKGQDVSVSDIRWSMYEFLCSNSDELTVVPEDTEMKGRYNWGIYHANDMLHVCYEALMKYCLDILEGYSAGLPISRLLSEVVEQLQAACAIEEGVSWREFVEAIEVSAAPNSVDDEISELSLLGEIVGGTKLLGICAPECAMSAVMLLAIIYKRCMPLVESIKSSCPPVYEHVHQQSIYTELGLINSNADLPFGKLLELLVKERVLERHLWVGMQKLRASGDYTFLIESDGGYLRTRKKDTPVLTNPRLRSALLFLRDIYLIDENGLTPKASNILEAQ